MAKEDLNTIDTVSKFSNFEVLNPEFTRCRCNVFYTGPNRNYSDITDEALSKFVRRKGYANVPVVAHLYKDEKTGKLRVGGHDQKIVLSDSNGIEVINECVPFGVIPEDCNPSMETIIDRSGFEKKYFSVDLILWTHRYPILETAYNQEVYFNQSMELNFTEFHDDGKYTVVDDFTMSALCLLNLADSYEEGNVEPCFEDSRVKRNYMHFSLDEDEFKHNYELLLENLKKYSTDNKKSTKKLNKEGENQMELLKFAETLSHVKIENSKANKYALLNVTDSTVNVLDLEDYKAYAFNYAITSEDDVEKLIIDFDSKVEMSLSACEKIVGDGFTEFSIADCIDSEASKKSNVAMEEYTVKIQSEFNNRVDEIREQYEDLDKNYQEVLKELSTYKSAEKEREKKEHDKAIDQLINEFSKKLGKVPEFLIYKARLDYSKSVADVRKELTYMTGKSVMDNETKSNFSYNPISTTLSNRNKENNTSNRYGHLLDKYVK